MRILISWLRDFVDVPVAAPELADLLSMRGFEVAAIEDVPPGPLAPEGDVRTGGQPDAVIDFDITPNRPDCLSVIGMAREVATAFDLPLRNLTQAPAASAAGDGTRGAIEGLDVVLERPDLCPRYAAAVAEVQVGPSPAWLANRLTAGGVRPINNVVDVTNYVLLEIGHPTHAFDLDRLRGRTLRIRAAANGERVHTLDGEERTLDDRMLVIADAERPQAIAGVMGGAASEVWGGTRRIALESAYFAPVPVRQTSRRLGLKTEASSRFERGADIEAPLVAVARAADLLARLGAGRVHPGLIDCYPVRRSPITITLRRDRIGYLLGHAVDDEAVVRTLGGLGFGVTAAEGGWQVAVPSWRVDLAREADLIEEVARHYGYDKLPTTFPALVEFPGSPDPRIARDRVLRRVLGGAGFSEAIELSFIETAAARSVLPAGSEPVTIAYPLSEKFAALRPSLLPGLVSAVAHNRRRERRDVQLFELGARFSQDGGETPAVALAWTGTASPEHWSGSGRLVDFFDMKGAVDLLCRTLGVTPRYEPGKAEYLAPGRTAVVRAESATLGLLGLLAPAVAAEWGLPAGDEVYVAELDLSAVDWRPRDEGLIVGPLPRHPSVVRDLAILVDAALPAEAVRGTIVRAAPPTLVDLAEFDRYQGKGIPEGRVSLAWHLTFQSPDRTLTDAEVDGAMNAIVEALAREHQAVRR